LPTLTFYNINDTLFNVQSILRGIANLDTLVYSWYIV
jgi:hypothetical protein